MAKLLDYVGVKKCGCVVVWMSVAMPPKTLAKEAGRLIRAGLSVERMDREKARLALTICHCGHPEGEEQRRLLNG